MTDLRKRDIFIVMMINKGDYMELQVMILTVLLVGTIYIVISQGKILFKELKANIVKEKNGQKFMGK